MRERFLIILTALLFGGVVGGGAIWFIARSSDTGGTLIEGHPLSYWVKCLDNDNAEIRLHAVAVLPKFGPDAVKAVIPMLDTAVGQDAAIEVLAKIGTPSVQPLIHALEAGSPQLRIGAILALDRMGGSVAGSAVSPVAKLIDDDSTGAVAANFVCHAGPNADAVTVALGLLENSSDTRQLWAIKVLSNAKDPRIEEALRKAATAKNPAVHAAAFEALCGVNPPSIASVPIMIEHLTVTESRTAARVGLSSLGSAAIEPLRACATQPSRDLRVQAVDLLAQRVSIDPPAAEALVDFLSDDDATVASTAAASLSPIRQKDMAFVRRQLKSPKTKVRIWAVREMRKVQPPVIDEIAQMLDDNEEPVRNEAAEAIRGIWTADDPLVLHAPKAKDVNERIRGIRLLPFFRDSKKYDMMIAAMEDPEPQVRLAATRALGRSLMSGRAVERLVEALKHDASSQVRTEAAIYLMPARTSLNVAEALRQAASDPDPNVAAAAQSSLRERHID